MQNSVTTIPENDSLSIMAAPAVEEGNAEEGYKYLTEGNAFSTGIPMTTYKIVTAIRNGKLMQTAGYNKFSVNDFVIFKNAKGRLTAAPGCLYCHAQQFNNQLVIGLGNSYSNFQVNSAFYLKLSEQVVKLWYGKNSDDWKTAEKAFTVARTLNTSIKDTNERSCTCAKDRGSNGFAP